ncbi:ATP-dependent RNA helicase HrpA [Actinotalea sp. M2MS4P-6]|uniref:ATP-dependent RNA helicase HrpA n=1 Tax=Actinotalea sp. M2MS4P-6 TaxID=2983762 RepID=UPI0021E4F7AF|nr:ATP-dependent RNA helicase HrpA [Actinotalea sp. M2MS4P-6]MCV2392740.1 ATP-dependent RNA helicase HrpA [Actinotalea sp. M2MS4P-6]
MSEARRDGGDAKAPSDGSAAPKRRGRRGRGRSGDPSRRDRRPPADRPRRPNAEDRAARERRAEARRAVAVPPITYPESLPVSARRAEIAEAIRDHQVVIVAGETGSGKTTQLPKILLELGRGRDGQIGHTQPRRIAARSVAERISEEVTGGRDGLGTLVGYQVRFTDLSSEQTLVKVMTDGILLAQIQRDPMLLGYDTIVIDEAHERSLNIDFLLGYLRRLLERRPDLKLVITSATIDSERFARHFGTPPSAEHPDGVPAPVVQVSGRTYPVEVRYRPLTPDPEPDEEHPEDSLPAARTTRTPRGEDARDLMTGICEAVDELAGEGPGDILVFLSGEREIRDAEDALRSHLGADRTRDHRHPGYTELLPLYSRLSAAEQHRVFESHPGRRVVLATNVAETSLTVPGVRYVVDPGTARISRWSKATKVQRLPIEPVSQASAAQRSGRCGRVADGVAIRLYSEQDLASRPEFTEPEILRTSLASVILQMISIGVVGSPEEIASFPFVEPPDTRAVRDGVQLLVELGALEQRAERLRLTEVGRALALLPIDPRLARMIVEAGKRDVAREVMIIAAALSIQDPRERPAEEREQADAMHSRFADPGSDLLAYLNLWHHVRDQQRELSGSAFRRMCRAEHLSFLRLREWQDVVTQLRELAKPLGITVRPPRREAPVTEAEEQGGPVRGSLRRDWDGEAIHRSVLAGLLSQIGQQEATEVRAGGSGRDRGADRRGKPRPRNEYVGARGARFAIFPGSALSKKPPAWVMAAELVETSRLWARDVARIEPEWAEELAPHLVKRSFSEPTWSAKQGAATALERVTLYGVPIVVGRRVLYAKVDPEHARELFLRHALVEGDWTTHHRFFHTNRALLAQAEELENRARRRDLVVDDDALFAFYDERVPADVVSARHFDQWWNKTRRAQPDLLTFDPAMLVGEDADAARDPALYPERWPQGDLDLAVHYAYDPGTEHDGVSVEIPLQVLERVVPDGFDRLVPGMQAELAVATIRALPKPVRVQLVPAPDVAAAVVGWLAGQPTWADTVRAGDAAPSWHETFAQAVRALRGVEIPDDAFDDSRLPAHLRITFRVVEERRGGMVVVDEGHDLVALQRRLASQAESAVRSAMRDAIRRAVAERDATAGAGTAEHGAAAGRTAPADADAGSRASSTGGPGSGHAGSGPADGGPTGARPPGRPGPTARPGPGRQPGHDLERTGLTTWPTLPTPDDEIPEQVSAEVGGVRVEGFPALVADPTPERPTTADLRVLARPDPARHAVAVRELLLGELALSTGRVTSRWSSAQSLALAASPYPSTAALVLDLQRSALDALLDGHGGAQVRDRVRYEALRGELRDELEDRTHRVATDLAAVLTAARELDADLRAAGSLALLSTVHELRGWSTHLVRDRVASGAGAERLPHLVRYLRAAQHRLAKAAENVGRDESLAWQVAELAEELDDAVAAARARTPDPARDAALEDVRWMLEELRVSLFAQQLGTPQPVSVKRVRTALAAAAR